MLPAVSVPVSSPFPRRLVSLDHVNLDQFKTSETVEKFYFIFNHSLQYEQHLPVVSNNKLKTLLFALVQRTKEIVKQAFENSENRCSINVETDLYGSPRIINILRSFHPNLVQVTHQVHNMTKAAIVCIVQDAGIDTKSTSTDSKILPLSWQSSDLFNPKLFSKRNQHPVEFCKKFDEMRLNNILTDFEIVVKGELIRVHKAVLGICSSFFLEMFRNNSMQEALTGRITVDQFDALAMKRAIEFVYTGELVVVNPTLEDYLNLLDIAYDFAFPSLLAEAEFFVSGFYKTPDQMISIALHAFKHGHLTLASRCIYDLRRVSETNELDLKEWPIADKEDLIKLGEEMRSQVLVAAAKKIGVEEEEVEPPPPVINESVPPVVNNPALPAVQQPLPPVVKQPPLTVVNQPTLPVVVNVPEDESEDVDELFFGPVHPPAPPQPDAPAISGTNGCVVQ